MTIVAADFRNLVINPALAILAPAGIPVTQVAADLLMATAAVESNLGTWLSQDQGPALGVFQIDPASLLTLITRASPHQTQALYRISTPQSAAAQINTNLLLAAAICRLYYWQVPDPLPPDTVSGLWGYYKTFYNSKFGATTESEFIAALKLTDLGGLPP
jgi:hypothetical protein